MFDDNGQYKKPVLQVACGNGHWRRGISTLNKSLPCKIAASGGWTDRQTYQINLYFLTPVLSKTPPAMTISQMPYGLTIRCRFVAGQVFLDLQANVALLENLPNRLTGSLA